MKKGLIILGLSLGLLNSEKIRGQERVWQPALEDSTASFWEKVEIKGTCGTQATDTATFQSLLTKSCGPTGIGGWVKIEAEQENGPWDLQWAKMESHGTCDQIKASGSWAEETLAELCQGQPASHQTWLKLEVGKKEI